MTNIMNFIRDEEGLELSEYALILGIIAILVITIIGDIGTKIKDIFDAFKTGIGA